MHKNVALLLPIVFLFTLLVTAPAQAGPQIKDMRSGHWAEAAVTKLVDKGIIQLYPDDKFKGNRPLSRYAMAEVLSRTLDSMDKEHAKLMKRDEIEMLQRLMRELSDEIVELRLGQMKIEDQQEALKDEWAEFKKDHNKRLSTIEKRLPVKINGTMRYRYQVTDVKDQNGDKGRTTRNKNRFRLDIRVPIDESMMARVRWRAEQPSIRNGDSAANTQFRMQYAYLNKKNLLGGDWRFGRQYGGIGNNMLFLNYYDGITHTRKFGHGFSFKGIVLAGQRATTTGTSHGLSSNILSVAYTNPNCKKKHTFTLTRFENNANDAAGTQKYGVLGTKEGWASLDVKGKISNSFDYFGTWAMYNNQFDENDVTPTTQYLRGDTDNTGYMLALRWKPNKKFWLRGMVAAQDNNFRIVDMLTDLYYLEGLTSPLEEAITALTTSAQIPGGAVSRIRPGALSRPGESQQETVYYGNIAGYRDMQLNTEYWARKDLKLCMVADWLKPIDNNNGMKDVTAVTARVRYYYTKKHRLELRLMSVTSDYSTRVNDVRTEWFMTF